MSYLQNKFIPKFENWVVFNENITIAELLRKSNPEDVKSYRPIIKQNLSNHLTGNNLETITNLFCYLYITEQIPISSISNQIQKDWAEYGAYIAANVGQSNKFHIINDRQTLSLSNLQWHRDISVVGKKRKGPQGLPVVNISKSLTELIKEHPIFENNKNYNPVIWNGWNWVSLGCGKSKEEGAAGGHCGNEGNKAGDNILSLRDPKGNVHLTFIVNIKTGLLGEAKGQDNNKPSQNYHPAIVALLMSDYITKYKGGGYKPENNFHPDDIQDPKIKEIINNKLEKSQPHKIPENYKQLEWLNQWDQSKVDALNKEQKLNLLIDLIKTLNNYDPLTAYEYDEETKENKTKEAPTPLPINFSLNKLTLDSIPSIKNIKQGLEILEDLHEINSENIIGSVNDLVFFAPHLKDKSHLLTPMINRYHSQDQKPPLLKKENLFIESSTLTALISHIEKLIIKNKGSDRDKTELIGLLNEIGYRYDKTSDVSKSYNIYQNTINQLTLTLIDKILESKSPVQNYTKDVIIQFIDDYTRDIAKEANLTTYSLLTQDDEKIIIRIESDYSETKIESELINVANNAYSRISNEMIRKGLSSFMVGTKKEKWGRCVNKIVKQNVSNKLTSVIKNTFKGKVALEESNWIIVNYFMPFKSSLKEFKETGKIKEIKQFIDYIKKLILKYYNEIIKNIDKFILTNANEIIQCVNFDKVYNKKYDKVIKEKRPIIQRHEHFTFEEWIKTR